MVRISNLWFQKDNTLFKFKVAKIVFPKGQGIVASHHTHTIVTPHQIVWKIIVSNYKENQYYSWLESFIAKRVLEI